MDLADQPLPNHTWTRTGVSLQVFRRIVGKMRVRDAVVDFDIAGVKRGGLLEAALRSLECPVGENTVRPLIALLNSAKLSSQCIRFLSTSPADLDSADVLKCFQLIEDAIALSGTTHKSHDSYSTNIHSVLASCEVPLKDGRKVANIKFKSRFQGNPPPIAKNVWREFSIPNHPDPDLRTPLVFRDFDSIKDRNDKAAATVQKTKYFIERKCVEVLDAHQALVTGIRNLKGEDIPELEELYFR